jgi:hypothetical protein
MPPTVRDLQTAITQEQNALKPQQDIIDQQIGINDMSGAAQEQGLVAQQKAAFGGIEQAAQNKGMLFSGFSPDEQAKYTAGTYLPALAQLQATIAGSRAQLMGKKVDLNKAAYDKASAMVEQDRAVLADWNKMTHQEQFQASEADKQRAWDARQREAQRAFDASQNAANRATAAAANAKPDVAGITGSVGKFLSGRVGADGKVSPASFQEGRQQWVAAGGSPDSFNQVFAGYVNTDHYWNYYGSK